MSETLSTESGEARPPKNARPRNTALFVRDLIIILVVAILVSFLIKTFLVRSFYIPSGSMENTLQINDLILVNELEPNLMPIHHGDVVVFKDPGGWLPAGTENTPTNPIEWALSFVGRPVRGERAFGRIYAGWALSQTFYRDELWRGLGFSSLDDFLIRNWETTFARRHPADLLAQLWTWQHGDISANELYGGDFGRALSAITAKAIVMPSATDPYFPVADNEIEVSKMPNARCVPIPTVWGHVAGAVNASPADTAFINDRLGELLAS